MQKKQSVLLFAATTALLLAACTPADITIDDDMDDASSSTAMMEDDSSSSATVDIDFDAGTTTSTPAAASSRAVTPPVTGTPRVVDVAVTTWSFSPATITAKKGEKVQLRLTGGTGIHSFAVADLGMNVRVEAGQTVTVDLPTDTVGTFAARCRVPCGPGHNDMTATVIISE